MIASHCCSASVLGRVTRAAVVGASSSTATPIWRSGRNHQPQVCQGGYLLENQQPATEKRNRGLFPRLRGFSVVQGLYSAKCKILRELQTGSLILQDLAAHKM